MNCQTNVTDPTVEQKESIIHFPEGLPGFERIKDYVLLADPDEAPFAWLQMTDTPNQSFLVVSPLFVSEDYNPDIHEEDVAALGIKTPEDALVFNIVTLHSDGDASVNLKGPLVVNRHTLVAKQAIPINAEEFSVEHPLNVTQS